MSNTDTATDVDVIDRLLQAADQYRDRLVDLVARAVRIPSVMGHEREISEFFEAEARAGGFEVDAWAPDDDALRAHPAYVPVDYGYSDRNNVVARLPGAGSGRTLALFGHLDTVPVDPNTTWEHDPYSGDIEDGKIFGRGSADMKAGCGVALVALEVMRDLGVRLNGHLEAHLILDEEAGGNGTLAAVQRGHYGPDVGCIMMEPTGPERVIISNRGAQFFRVRVPGEEGGTEYHRDLFSAIDGAIVVYEAVKAFSRMREAALLDPKVRDPLYDAYRRTRVPTAVCKIQAGAWPSTVAGEAVLEGTVECLPGEDIREIVDALERYLAEVCADHWFLKDHPVRFERFGLWFEAAGLKVDDPFVAALERASEQALGRRPQILGGGGSDLRLPLLYAGSPTALWGPGGGPIHSVDEWASIDQMVDMLKACLVAAVEWCGVGNGSNG
jgi:acetylornithine deacetylase